LAGGDPVDAVGDRDVRKLLIDSFAHWFINEQMNNERMSKSASDLQRLCEQGQDLLIGTEYLRAEAVLLEAERIATETGDFDTLSRLYLPLQEARRQRRQRCGEGMVVMDLIATSPNDQPDAEQVVAQHPHGELLVAGWGSIAPAVRVRQMQAQRQLYVESFLGATYPTRDGTVVLLAPLADVPLPNVDATEDLSFDEFRARLPMYCFAIEARHLPRGPRNGTWQTYAEVMDLWERLHLPYLQAADAGVDPFRKIEGYRRTIEVDYACELAHQKLSAVAHEIARRKLKPMATDREAR
jgi:hypothetical protein